MWIDFDMLCGFFCLVFFMVDFGVEFIVVEVGWVMIELVIVLWYCQYIGVVYVGVIVVLVDYMMGVVVQMLVSEGYWVLMVEFKISLLCGVSGEWLECEVWVMKFG